MLDLLKAEWMKLFRTWRTYAGFGVIMVALGLVFTGLALSNPESMIESRVRRILGSEFLLSGNFINGYFIGMIIMNTLFVHIPLLIAFVAGDLLAGEAASGTLRMYLSRPVTRIKVYTSKFILGLFYSALMVIFLGTVTFLLGWSFYGSGPLISVSKGLTIFTEEQALLRYLFAYFLAIIPMWTVVSLALLFSSLVRNSLGPIVGTMGVIITFLIVNNLNISFFDKLSPYLFTYYFNLWEHAYIATIAWNEVIKSISILFLYTGIFYIIGASIFVKKDILT